MPEDREDGADAEIATPTPADADPPHADDGLDLARALTR
ncbi:MAG: hypothetical protein JWM84_2655, partial [Nocardioides sp.]|nr:hypothetical protein [Nocardioides sp.]